MESIPVNWPVLEEEEIQAAVEALEMGWLGMGRYVGQFEEAVREYINAGNRYFIAVSSGTAAIHLGLLAADIGKGDEVILPSLNFVAAAQAIIATGAEPVFCDVYDDTVCVDLEKVEGLISPRTKAVLPVDYSCCLCDHEGLGQLAAKYGIRILHDAAHSFGSHYNGKMIGSFSDICIFSFDPIKTVTCIDGGMVVVRSKKEQEIIQAMRVVGMSQSTKVVYKNRKPLPLDVKGIGYRYHLVNLHAAIGIAQLKKIDRIVNRRRELCQYYNEHLSQVDELKLPKSNFKDIVPFIYYVRVPANQRDDFRTFLKGNGINTGIHWPPMHRFTFLRDFKKGDLTVTEKIGDEIVSLPMYPNMDEKTIDTVIGCITSFFNKGRKI